MSKKSLKHTKSGCGLIIGENVKLYGHVVIGDNCTIEDNVIIGHPPQNYFDNYRQHQSNFDCISMSECMSNFKSDTLIGNDCVIRSGSIIYAGVIFGNNVVCSHNVIVRENTNINDSTYIKNNTEIFTEVRIGKNCRISGSICDRSRILDNVSSFGALVHSYKNPIGGLKEPAPVIKEGCVIGRNAVIIGDVTIGEYSYVAAGAIVTKDVSPHNMLKSGGGVLTVRRNMTKPKQFTKE